MNKMRAAMVRRSRAVNVTTLIHAEKDARECYTRYKVPDWDAYEVDSISLTFQSGRSLNGHWQDPSIRPSDMGGAIMSKGFAHG